MGWYEDAKSVLDFVRQTDNFEIIQKMLDVQAKALEFQGQLEALREENRRLQEQLKTNENLYFEGNAYWKKVDGEKEGPFCSVCWDSLAKLVRLHSGYKKHLGNYIICRNCSIRNREK